MIDEKHEPAGWISSIDIINKTGISRATLNNYIKMNILPRPHVKKPEEVSVRARMLGYFPKSVIDVIEQIKILKGQGYTIKAILEKLNNDDLIDPSGGAIMPEESGSQDITDAGKFRQPQKRYPPSISAERKYPLDDPFSVRRNIINDLLRQRMPTLTSFCVLVANLQNSVRLCAELPPYEYFELINQICVSVEGSFKQYYGVHGKHAGTGMLYYFLKERDNQYMINAVLCALEIRKNIKQIDMKWKVRKGWFNELQLNIGINEGEEYFGTIQAAPGAEFTALGDTVNHAGRLSDFARCGAIWTTKSLINKLGDKEKKSIRYGIRHIGKDHEVLIEDSFGRIMDIMIADNVKNSGFMDIATLAITEIVGPR